MNREEIIGIIENYVQDGKQNFIPECDGVKLYEGPPLVGFASALDPLYAELKRADTIGPHHWMPQDWVKGARTVIVYFLPFTREVVESNHTEGMSSKEWYLARYYGEELNNGVRDRVVEALAKAGLRAVAPSRSEKFEMQAFTSNWSERHSAYIAGLGSFCLSYSFITEKGCAGRYGTIVTDLELEPSPRKLGLRDNCLFDEEGTCGLCIARCPAGAITAEKKDHGKCLEFLVTKVMAEHVPRWNIVVGGCGKCQTKVPCARKIPKKADLNSSAAAGS
ncbi:MAG: epoxyqueuosine reductase [bacterium]